MPDGVLDQRLNGQDRDRHRQHLRRQPQGDPEPVAEPGLLEVEVALDRLQLLGERGELTVAAEGVAGEVGELQQQLASPFRVGPHEGRDRGQRVVDEVRADLRPQRTDLGLHETGARRVKLGELELTGRPPGHLLGSAHQARGGRHREHLQGADGAVLDGQRRHDRVTDRAACGGAFGLHDGRGAGADHVDGVRRGGVGVMVVAAVPGE